MRKIIYLSFLAIALSGCVTMSITSVNLYRDDLDFPSKNPKDIKVFQKLPPGKEFIEIGEVTAESAQWGVIEKAFKIKAAELGGDAAYVVRESGNFVAGITIQKVTAVVIKYKD